MHIQKWYNLNNQQDSDLIYKECQEDQLFFFRDIIPRLFMQGNYQSEISDSVKVISTHTSKSVLLPVVEITWKEIKFVFRDNFYDWKISVESFIPICVDFHGLFDPDKEHHKVYFEGFPEERVYGSYNNDRTHFSVQLVSSYAVYTFLFLIVSQMPSTKEE